ncbi:MAG: TIGR00299 family protein [Synechococcus sp. SAT82]|nr:TIGR00299 family protein [Synechococcus sp. SAT82]
MTSAPVSSLHIDCPTGLAGDMLLAALFDLGVPMAVVQDPLHQLGLSELVRLDLTEARSGGLRGQRLSVRGLEPDPPHRQWADIRQRIVDTALNSHLKSRVLAVFTALAEAEARVHGCSVETVHFHEVGAIDALVDVVGVCAAVTHLSPRHLSCDPPPAGCGSVRTAHGLLPVPVPAVLELARAHGVPLRQDTALPEGELTTPTGLALVAVLADSFNPPSVFTPAAIGIGLGHRQLDRPNLVRLCLSHDEKRNSAIAPRWQPLVVQEAWIDDASPEDVALLVDQLRAGGAVDVACHPLQMKKSRTGLAITALMPPGLAESLRDIWWSAGSSIGLRERSQGRWLLPRRSGSLRTPWGRLRAKQVQKPDGHCSVKPEADDLQSLSKTSGCTVEELRQAAAAAEFETSEPWSW